MQEQRPQGRPQVRRAPENGELRRRSPEEIAARRAAMIKRKKKKRLERIIKLAAAAVVLLGIVIAIICIAGGSGKNGTTKENELATVADNGGNQDALPAGETESETEAETEPETEAGPPTVVATATIGAAGDILTHNYVLNTAFDGYDTYDFTNNFKYVAPYWSAVDYMIVNLEVPCGGSQGEKGSQYPTFDAPDSIVTDLKAAGVDMFLTASNHTFDCYGTGLIYTQELINSVGLDHTGTRLNSSDNFYIIKDIKGIKFGMVCYTYDTREEVTDYLTLNGIYADDGCEDLVNTFCYSDKGLEILYKNVKSDIDAMNAAGCDVKVFFMHWGTEYMDAPSEFIQGIAQKLADLGVDLIIGGHPHVIQPFDILTGSGGNTTYCIYSTGNCISSQRKEVMNEDDYRGYTEDGLTIEFTYDKYSDGSTKLAGIYVLPLWVDGVDYSVCPLDASLDPSEWAVYNAWEAVASYNRTEGRIGEAYPELRAQLGQEAVPSVINY